MDLTQLEMRFNAVDGQHYAGAHRVPSNLTTRIRRLKPTWRLSVYSRNHQRLRLSPAGHNLFTLQPADPALLMKPAWWLPERNRKVSPLGALHVAVRNLALLRL